MTRHLHAVLLAGLLAVGPQVLGQGTARAESLVVADARGVALQPGQSIDAAQPLKLAQGQRVTLIAANGATIKLSGPFEGVPDPNNQRGTSVADSLVRLASQTTQSTSTLGAVRNTGVDAAPADPWVLDVSASGQRCLKDGVGVVFWRPAQPAERAMQIAPTDRAWQAEAPWPANTDRLAMPPNFPAQDGQGYLVTVGGQTSTVTLHLMPASVATDVMRAAWMIEKGCVGQARVLVSSLK
jgi:hypothetical protein